ncbi:hypothetical protein BDN67DRAFT_973846 [Paxillus ammoniavirescens]|nr:hypothetical protein BDN67DRAFT_973846 [Paxillus ammoniavirescens]
MIPRCLSITIIAFRRRKERINALPQLIKHPSHRTLVPVISVVGSCILDVNLSLSSEYEIQVLRVCGSRFRADLHRHLPDHKIHLGSLGWPQHLRACTTGTIVGT